MTDDGVTRVYIEAGTVAHFIDGSPNSTDTEALCGRTSWPGLWHGTGTQEELERAADLRVCSPCLAVLNHRRNGYLQR